MDSRPILLVHGAWHGAWCWDPVLALLAARQIRASAIDLPGHGTDPGTLTDLHGDAESVWSALDRFDDPVILVGHSYGGVVITEAGVHPQASHLVYVASFNLDEGESAMAAAIAQTEAASIDHSERPDVFSYTHLAADGTSTIDSEGARISLLQRLS